MNNDLEQFSEERLKEIAMDAYEADFSCDEIEALARIALAAKQAKPVNSPCEKCKGSGFMDSGGTQPWGEPISVECDCTTPQPAHTEQDGWIKCSERMPQNNEQVLTWNGQYKATDLFLAGCFLCNKPKLITHWVKLPAAPKPESE